MFKIPWMKEFAEHRRHRPCVLFFDYDGTLSPIRSHPDLAILAPSVRESLRRLDRLPNVRISVVSSRSLTDVRKLVGIPGLYYGGSGGLEIDLKSECLIYPGVEKFQRAVSIIEPQLLDILERSQGAWIERKPMSLTIHYRNLLQVERDVFRWETLALFGAFPEIQAMVVSEAIEVSPMDGWDKGTAVDRILSAVAQEYEGRIPFPLYFGDAINDEPGMRAVQKAGGIAIGIGEEAPEIATIRYETPLEMHRDIERMKNESKTTVF